MFFKTPLKAIWEPNYYREEKGYGNNTGAISQHKRANGCPSSIQIDNLPPPVRRPSLPESGTPEPLF